MCNRYKVQILRINQLIIRYSASWEVDTEQLVCQKLFYLLSLHIYWKRMLLSSVISTVPNKPMFSSRFENQNNTLGADPGFPDAWGEG